MPELKLYLNLYFKQVLGLLLFKCFTECTNSLLTLCRFPISDFRAVISCLSLHVLLANFPRAIDVTWSSGKQIFSVDQKITQWDFAKSYYQEPVRQRNEYNLRMTLSTPTNHFAFHHSFLNSVAILFLSSTTSWSAKPVLQLLLLSKSILGPISTCHRRTYPPEAAFSAATFFGGFSEAESIAENQSQWNCITCNTFCIRAIVTCGFCLTSV